MVTVIIPARNAEATLGEQLDALRQQTYEGPLEVVVADNGSTDQTRSVVLGYQDLLSNLSLIDASQKSGPAYARNVAARHAHGDFLVLCDADDIIGRDWIRSLGGAASHHDIVAGVLHRQTGMTSQSGSIEFASNHFLGHHLRYAPSGNMGIWADVFQSLGGFDEDLTTGEDVDFSWRAQSVGFSLGLASTATVYYRPRTGSVAVFRQFYRRGRGRVELARRHPEIAAQVRADRLSSKLLWLLSRLPYLVLPQRREIWIRQWARSLGTTVELARRDWQDHRVNPPGKA